MRRLGAVGLSAAFILVLLAPAAAWAADPLTNDMFANATPIAGTGDLDAVNLRSAGVEAGEPQCSNSPASASAWYVFTASETGALLTEIVSPVTPTLRIGAYRETGGGISALALVSCRPGGPVATARVEPGQKYYVQIADTGTAPGVVSLRFTYYPPPPNDNLASAKPVPTFPWADTVPLLAATAQTDEPNPCNVPSWTTTSRSVWYTLTPPASGTLSVRTSGDYFVDAKVAVFTGGYGWGGLDPGVCAWVGQGAPATVQVVTGQRYYIQAAAYSGFGTLTIGFSLSSVVADTTPPTIFGTPSDISMSVAGPGGAAIGYATPTAVDDVSGPVPVTCIPASGSIFPIGTTRVTCTATDAAGNAATTGFNVTVNQLAPIAVSPIIPITSYDMDDAAMSGSGCWHHAYFGTVTDLGRTFYSGGTCPPAGGHLAAYRGGSGTLNDGYDARSTDEDQLVFVGQTDDHGGIVAPVITLHLDGAYRVSAIRIYGGQFANGLPGALTRATVTIGGRSVTLDTIPFGAPGPLGFPTNDLLDLTGTPLASVSGSTVVLRGFASAFIDQFSIAEITVDGTAAPADTTPPVPSIAGIASPYAVDARIAITGSATDLVDPAPVVACTLAGPGTSAAVPCAYSADAWSLGTLGTYTFTITATDASNNTATTWRTFDVVATYTSVENLTKAWSSKTTVAKDLVAILESARAAEKRGAYTAEANKLADYRAGVKAQSGKAFAAEKAAKLIGFSYGL